MKISIILITLLVIALYKCMRWKLVATIFVAWMAENNYVPPEEQDMERLAKWVVQKPFKKK